MKSRIGPFRSSGCNGHSKAQSQQFVNLTKHGSVGMAFHYFRDGANAGNLLHFRLCLTDYINKNGQLPIYVNVILVY